MYMINRRVVFYGYFRNFVWLLFGTLSDVTSYDWDVNFRGTHLTYRVGKKKVRGEICNCIQELRFFFYVLRIEFFIDFIKILVELCEG